jgi:SAM-dependent methyltransferase
MRSAFRAGEAAANVVMVDVLHHLEFPAVFFRDVARVLRPGGRVLMVGRNHLGQPCLSAVSSRAGPDLGRGPRRALPPSRDPYDSNQAAPTILATRDHERFIGNFPTFVSCASLVRAGSLSAQQAFRGAW